MLLKSQLSIMHGLEGVECMPYKDRNRRMEYQKEYQKGWYRKNKEKVLGRRKQRRRKIRDWLRHYKSKLFCIDCGENHPACLQFHHKHREEKSFTISNVAGRDDISLTKLMNEIEKCEVLCVNCHAKRHWQEADDFDSC